MLKTESNYNRIIVCISIVGLIGLIAMLNISSPTEIGPFGVLLFFTTVYIVFVGIFTLLLQVLLRRRYHIDSNLHLLRTSVHTQRRMPSVLGSFRLLWKRISHSRIWPCRQESTVMWESCIRIAPVLHWSLHTMASSAGLAKENLSCCVVSFSRRKVWRYRQTWCAAR